MLRVFPRDADFRVSGHQRSNSSNRVSACKVVTKGKQRRAYAKTMLSAANKLTFYIIVHVHQIYDALHVVRDISITMNRMFDHTRSHRKIQHIRRLEVIHIRKDQPSGK